MMTNKTAKKRFEYLSRMLAKYNHRWSDSPSCRMYAWVDEFNELADTHREAFREYCESKGLAFPHDAMDCLA